MPRFSPALLPRIARLAGSGALLREIAVAMDVDRSTIGRWCRRYGIKPLRRPTRPCDRCGTPYYSRYPAAAVHLCVACAGNRRTILRRQRRAAQERGGVAA